MSTEPEEQPLPDHIDGGMQEFLHLGLDRATLEALWLGDPVIAGFNDRIAQLQAVIEKFVKEEELLRGEISEVEAEEVDLNARLRSLDTKKREIRGRLETAKYHQRLAKSRIRERNVAIGKRRKQVWKSEVKRRLDRLGKDFRHNSGRRGGGGFDIIDKQ